MLLLACTQLTCLASALLLKVHMAWPIQLHTPVHRNSFLLPLCAHHQVDLVDLGEGRDPRFRYVLVVVELYTRFIWIYPLPTKHALLVARHVSGQPAQPALLANSASHLVVMQAA